MKWSTIAQKPRYSYQMENGVLYFVALGVAHGRRYGIQSGNKSAKSTMKIHMAGWSKLFYPVGERMFFTACVRLEREISIVS